MDFERLPKNIFLDILGHLPLTERIRVKGVNNLWFDMCTLAIQERPVSIYFPRVFRRITTMVFRGLLQLCHRNVNNMVFDYADDEYLVCASAAGRIAQLLSIVAEFNYPNCVDLMTSGPVRLFLPIIGNAPNLKILRVSGKLGNDFLTRLPDGSCTILEELEMQEVSYHKFVTSATFRFLGQRCKNLKSFVGYWKFQPISGVVGQAEIEDMNYFFGECAELRRITYNETDIFARAPNFWKLKMLKHIEFHRFKVDDQFLHSLSGSFSLITRLSIRLANGVTGSGVGCLSRMQNLHHLDVYGSCFPRLVLKDEFDTLVNNVGSLKHLSLRYICTDAARLEAAASIFAMKDAFLKVGIFDKVENIIPVLERFRKDGINFKCGHIDDDDSEKYYDLPDFMSGLNKLKADSIIKLNCISLYEK